MTKIKQWAGLSHQQRLEIYGECKLCHRIGFSQDVDGMKCWEHLGVYDDEDEDDENEAVR